MIVGSGKELLNKKKRRLGETLSIKGGRRVRRACEISGQGKKQGRFPRGKGDLIACPREPARHRSPESGLLSCGEGPDRSDEGEKG